MTKQSAIISALLFPTPLPTLEELEKQFPNRDGLKDGATVIRIPVRNVKN